MSKQIKRTIEDVISDEKKLLEKSDVLVVRQKELARQEEAFFSNYGQSMSSIRQILDNYTSPSTRNFYEDLLARMEGSKKAMAIAFEEDGDAIKAESKAIDDRLTLLYEERLTLQNQVDSHQATSDETATTDSNSRKEK